MGVKPTLVCQLKFTEWAREDRLRQPVFRGRREDKSVSEVVREKASWLRTGSGRSKWRTIDTLPTKDIASRSRESLRPFPVCFLIIVRGSLNFWTGSTTERNLEESSEEANQP